MFDSLTQHHFVENLTTAEADEPVIPLLNFCCSDVDLEYEHTSHPAPGAVYFVGEKHLVSVNGD